MDKEQYKILTEKGVVAWNRWRNENNNMVDLTNANLEGADLSGADLEKADLKSANLEGADLSRANLNRSTLRGATLRGANLRFAKLRFAKLTDADLTNANLTNSKLTDADITGATLTGATLTGATLTFANLIDTGLVNLTNVTLINADCAGGRRGRNRIKIYDGMKRTLALKIQKKIKAALDLFLSASLDVLDALDSEDYPDVNEKINVSIIQTKELMFMLESIHRGWNWRGKRGKGEKRG